MTEISHKYCRTALLFAVVDTTNLISLKNYQCKSDMYIDDIFLFRWWMVFFRFTDVLNGFSNTLTLKSLNRNVPGQKVC